MKKLFERYLLPGLVYQGVVIGGGYATGRELAEFFMPSGPWGGLLGMGAAALVWSLVMAISFEICRASRSYDYKNFFQQLLGRFWFLYEILLVILMILILSVVGAAAGEIVQNLLGASPVIGSLLLLAAVGLLVFYGNRVIERFMGFWSFLLYVTYFMLVVWCFATFGDEITANFAGGELGGRWFWDGVRYAGYNIAAVPVVFFALRHLKTRKEAITAGLLAGPLGMLPAVFLYVAMMAAYPEVGELPIPSALLLARIDAFWFSALFQIVLLGTFVQTGVGLIHAINERVAATLAARGRAMPAIWRPIIAVLILLTALVLATRFGIIPLIGQGYGLLTYGFIAVFVLPVLTLGLVRVIRAGRPVPLPRPSSG